MKQFSAEMSKVGTRLHAEFYDRLGTASVDQQLAAIMAADFADAAKRRLAELSAR